MSDQESNHSSPGTVPLCNACKTHHQPPLHHECVSASPDRKAQLLLSHPELITQPRVTRSGRQPSKAVAKNSSKNMSSKSRSKKTGVVSFDDNHDDITELTPSQEEDMEKSKKVLEQGKDFDVEPAPNNRQDKPRSGSGQSATVTGGIHGSLVTDNQGNLAVQAPSGVVESPVFALDQSGLESLSQLLLSNLKMNFSNNNQAQVQQQQAPALEATSSRRPRSPLRRKMIADIVSSDEEREVSPKRRRKSGDELRDFNPKRSNSTPAARPPPKVPRLPSQTRPREAEQPAQHQGPLTLYDAEGNPVIVHQQQQQVFQDYSHHALPSFNPQPASLQRSQSVPDISKSANASQDSDEDQDVIPLPLGITMKRKKSKSFSEIPQFDPANPTHSALLTAEMAGKFMKEALSSSDRFMDSSFKSGVDRKSTESRKVKIQYPHEFAYRGQSSDSTKVERVTFSNIREEEFISGCLRILRGCMPKNDAFQGYRDVLSLWASIFQDRSHACV